MAIKICKICLTPYRKEIAAAWNQGIKKKNIFEKYAPLMGYTGNFDAWYAMANRHFKENHKADAIILPTPEGSANKVTTATIEQFGQRMLELGMAKIEHLTPDQVKLKDVIAAQKLILDSKKIKMSEDAMTLMMAEFFAPPIEGKVLEEGKIEDAIPTGTEQTIGTQQ